MIILLGKMGQWSSGMISALGADDPGFDSQLPPLLINVKNYLKTYY